MATKFLKQLDEHLAAVGFFLAALALTVAVGLATETMRGDSNEYFQMMESFSQHGTPDLREADIIAYNQLRTKYSLQPYTSRFGYFNSNDGRAYSYHFWLYPLIAVPVEHLLQVAGQNQIGTFEFLNYILLTGAMALLFFHSGFDRWRKLLFGALIVMSPVMWYLGWSNPEIFTCAFIVAAIALFSRGSPYLAILASAVAATQNPPAAILMLYFIAYAGADVIRKRNYINGVRIAACALPALAPAIFYLVKYGTPNLIFDKGFAATGAISLHRTFDFFFDLNMGLLPYLPFTLALLAMLLLRAWKRGKRRIYELAAVMLAMVVLSETTLNWNSDAAGLMRYAVWMIPLLVWGVVDTIDFSALTDRVFLAVALLGQLVLVIAVPARLMPSYVEHDFLASFVLDRFPSLYSPVQETFAERTLGYEFRRWPEDAYEKLPVIYCNGGGYATKVLTDYPGLMRLNTLLNVDAGYLADQKADHAGDDGLFYLNAAGGQMRCRSG